MGLYADVSIEGNCKTGCSNTNEHLLCHSLVRSVLYSTKNYQPINKFS